KAASDDGVATGGAAAFRQPTANRRTMMRMNIEVSFIRLESKVNEYPNAPGCGLVAKYSARWQHSQYHLAAAGGCAARVQCQNLFSVQPLGTLCLCGEKDAANTHHRDTESSELVQ